jgi:hypothetical protein
MTTINTTPLNIETIRQTLANFWGEMLEVNSTRKGFALAMPLCYPDGWQILLDLVQLTPGHVRLMDCGRTLRWLVAGGQNIETSAMEEHLAERMATFQLQRDGWTLFRDLPLPLAGVDVHLFGEAMASIAHLRYLHEAAVKTLNVPRQMLERVFRERHLEARTNYKLDGRLEKAIEVDYFVAATRPVAFQILNRRGRVTGIMEQWGFRWRDLRDAHEELLPAMIYDPAVSEVDEVAMTIGESVCELFCAYDETKRIHDLLEMAQNP